jgi:acetyl-CoA acetyltransferase
MEALEKEVLISGIGRSQVGRRLGREGLSLTIEAVRNAVSDAGLELSDIDGVASWPGQMDVPGFSPVSILDLKEALRLKVNWYTAGPEATQMSALINACMAVASGQARHVVCFRTMTESSAMAEGVRSSVLGQEGANRVGAIGHWQVPFGAFSAANWVGLIASRYFHEFGTRREQMAQIAINARRNAMLNPQAIYRTELTLDEYMNSRMISTPLCLYDCDVPVDGSMAFIVSHKDTVADLKGQPIAIESICGPLHERYTWDQQSDLTRFAAEAAGKRLWSRTDLKPKDVDVASLYDGFSFLTMLWLEALGFCGRGEAGAFIEDGKRIALDGELPLATGGGQLSAGRMHGVGLLCEAVTQLRKQGEARQVPGDPRVAVVAMGGGPIASAVLLARH